MRDIARFAGWFDAGAAPDPAALAAARLPAAREADPPPRGNPEALADKLGQLAADMPGQSELVLYHAGLIVHLRRGLRTDEMWARFSALWRDHAALLIGHLDSRWLISACDTFADFDEDPAARSAALATSLMANFVRLYETEQKSRGPDLRPLMPPRGRSELFDGTIAHGIYKGDTLRNAMQRLGSLAATAGRPAMVLDALVGRIAAADTPLTRFARLHRDDATRWRPAPPPAMRVALFNDTSVSRHFGCEAVLDTIERLFTGAGIALIHRHPVGRPWDSDPAAPRAIAEADAVVVNDEGTIHHDRPAGRRLAALAGAAAERGRPAYLINATLQDNDAEMVAALRGFRHIWVRESASAEWARARGLAVTLCPDLSLCQSGLVPSLALTGKPAVIDSVLPEANLALARHAAALGTRLWGMKHDEAGRLLSCPPPAVLRGDGTALPFEPFGPPRDFVGFARQLGARSRLITGRFHAVCLAMVLRLPFHAIASNTWKIEAMLADAGLDPRRLIRPDDPTPDALPFTAAEAGALDRYLRRARFEAGEMAARILALD